MMIGNLIKCKNCRKELQPRDILVGTDGNDLVSKCGYCGEVISII